jgi:tRNA threonylcarbamoyladenosine biosynthesis protein TsaE
VSPAAGELAPVRLRTESAQDTRALGAALASGLRPGDVVLLEGDLGSGKTTLAQGMATALGVADHVTSPTFTLLRAYPCAPAVSPRRGRGPHSPAELPAVRTFLHADLYRLEKLSEVLDLAIGELVEDGAVAVVEWGEKAEPVFGPDALRVLLAPGEGDDQRWVDITATASWGPRCPELTGLVAKWATP